MTEVEKKAYEYFKETREERGLTLSDAANALHLTVTLIEQMEAGDFTHQHLAPVFMRGYIRAYAKYLNLPNAITEEIANELVINSPLQNTAEKTMDTHRVEKKLPRNIKKMGLYCIVVILLAALGIICHHTDKTPVQQITQQEQSTSSTQDQATQDKLAMEETPITTETTIPSVTEEPQTAEVPAEQTNTNATTNSPLSTPNAITSTTPEETPIIIEPQQELTPIAPPVVAPIKPKTSAKPKPASPVPVENAQEAL